MSFAKLYETDSFGQILVMIDEFNDDGPSVRISFKPEGLGVCNLSLGNWTQDKEDSEKLEAAEKFFDSMTEEKAVKAVSGVYEQLGIGAGQKNEHDKTRGRGGV